MKLTNIFVMAAAAACVSILCACQSVGEDAEQTPIGSVISGETRSTQSYFDKVKEGNKAQRTNSWQPETQERL